MSPVAGSRDAQEDYLLSPDGKVISGEETHSSELDMNGRRGHDWFQITEGLFKGIAGRSNNARLKYDRILTSQDRARATSAH